MMDHLNKLRLALIAGLLVLLVACGGSEGTLNDTDEDGGSNNDNPVIIDDSPAVASLKLLSQNSQIPSDSSASTELTAIVRDSNNNFLSGVTVTFQADSGGIQVENATTDASGRATATLDAAGEPDNRVITVQAADTDTGVSDAIQVAVTGSSLSIVGPSSVTVNDEVEYLVSLRDSAGNGISGEDVEVTSSLGNTIGADTLSTDFNGELSISYTATITGAEQLSVSSLGLTKTQQITVSNDTFALSALNYTANESGVVEVPIDDGDGQEDDVTLEVLWESNGAAVDGSDISLSTTRGVLGSSTITTNAGKASTSISSTNAGPAVVTAEGADGPTAQLKIEFIALTPDVIDVQASPSSIGPNDSSTVTAIVRDPNGNLVKNQTVEFTITEDNSAGTISTGSSVTDSLGRAQTVYTASDATSANEGVVITATVQSDPAVTGSVSLTVADKALFVTIGSDYLIASDTGGVYSIEFALMVSDADGNPVEGVSVELSSQPVGYSTGCLELTEENADDEGEPEPVSSRGCGNLAGTAGKYSVYRNNDFCANEDLDFDGVNDPGEDANNNGILDPGNRAVIDDEVVTDESGRGLATFTYSAEYAFWYSYVITAVARVEGTETSHTARGTLPVLVTDLEGEGSPPNEVSPYGIGDC